VPYAIRRGPGLAEDSSYLKVKRRDDGSGAAAAQTELRESLSSTEVMAGLVNSAKEENKARAVVEIKLEPE